MDWHQLDNFDRLAGSLGILPSGLRDILAWTRDGQRCSLKELDTLLSDLRLTIFTHALRRWDERFALQRCWEGYRKSTMGKRRP